MRGEAFWVCFVHAEQSLVLLERVGGVEFCAGEDRVQTHAVGELLGRLILSVDVAEPLDELLYPDEKIRLREAVVGLLQKRSPLRIDT
ncbi:hypothetical protein GCM10009631_02450 [Corynebacterium glaucum]